MITGNEFDGKYIDLGYQLCDICDDNVHLLQAGFDVDVRKCDRCGCDVADSREFFEGT